MTMVNAILVLSKQGHAGFRTTASCSFSSVCSVPRRNASCLSVSFNSAARYHHHLHQGRYCLSSCPRILLQRPLHSASTASDETKRNGQGGAGAGVGWCSSFLDTTTSCRSFASKSQSNNHNTVQPRKEKLVREQRSGRRPQRMQQQKELLTVSDILDDCMQNHKRLESWHVASVWNKLGKTVVQQCRTLEERQRFWIHHKETLQTLVDQTIQSAKEFNGRSTATVTHSLVKLLHHTNSKSLGRGELWSLWNALLRKAILHIQSDGFNAHDMSNLIWAYAKADDDGIINVDGRLLDALADKAERCVDDFAPQGLSNIAWGFATMNRKVPFLLDAIARAAPVRIGDFKPQELSNTAWALATLRHEAPLLLDAIARAAQVRINDFSPQNLANTIWAFATLNHEAPFLVDAIADAALIRIGDFTPQALSNTAWAFATINHEAAPSLLDAIALAAQVQINEFKSQELSNMVWAFATLKHDAPPLFEAIARAVQVRINEFNPQNLANTVWSFATLNHEAPLLLDAIARAAQVRINEFSPQDLANTAWAFATLNHEAPLLFEAIAHATQVRIKEFNPQDLANTAWSFAVFNMESSSFTCLDSPFAQTLMSRDPSIFLVAHLHQLQQFHLWCKEHTGATTSSWYPVDLSRRCREAFVSAEAAPSGLQKNVVKALGRLQDVSSVEVEVSTKCGYSLDAVVMFRGERVGVEVDGPSHFVGRSQSPNGSTILKHRQVRALEENLKLVSVPYWEWNTINKEGSNKKRREKEERYLQNLLNL